MNDSSMRSGSTILMILTMIILVLVVVSGCLFLQKRSFEKNNRDLIITNDSIISVNIELTNQLKNRDSLSIKKTGKTTDENEAILHQ